jgi:acyl carrier protein
MSDRLDEVRRLVADVLNLDPESLGQEASATSIEAWDSIAHLNIIMSIEAAYDLEVDLEDAMTLSSVSGIATYLDKNLV